jgi:hypothetical protein
VALIFLSIALFWWLSLLFALLALILFIEAIATTRNVKISILAVYASFIQLVYYGYGFLKGFWRIHILKRNEQEAFPKMFF